MSASTWKPMPISLHKIRSNYEPFQQTLHVFVAQILFACVYKLVNALFKLQIGMQQLIISIIHFTQKSD